MPGKVTPINEASVKEINEFLPNNEKNEDEIVNLNRMLAAVLNYLSDDEVEEIDIEYILDETEGLREWWPISRKQQKAY